MTLATDIPALRRARALRWRPARDLILVAVALLAALMVLLMLGQVGMLVGSSLQVAPGQAIGLANFESVLGHPAFATVVANTLMLAVGSVVVMLAFAIPFAWLYARTDLPGKPLLIVVLTVKIAIPSFLVALGYIFLFNPSNGIGNQLAKALLGLEQSPFNVYSIGWMIALQGAALASPAFFMIVPVFRAIDAALEEAAWVSGIRQRTVVLRVIAPLAAPAILATAIYYFVIAVETFDYPSMLGLPVRTFVMSTWLYNYIYGGSGVPRYGEAAALGMVTAVAAVLLTLLYLWATRRAGRYVVVTGKRRQQTQLALSRRAKWLAWILIGLYALFSLVLPLIMLVWTSLLPFLQAPSAKAFQALTLSAYREAFALLPPLLANTLIVMLVVPTVSVAFAACIAWVSTRTQLPGRRALDVVVMAAIAVPSIVGALAFLQLGLALHHVIPIYTTIWLIVIAMSTRYVTWGNRTIASAMLQVHRELEEAGATSGIRRGRTFASIMLPTVRPALMFSWFWIALLSLRELTIPIMLVRPNTEVMSTAIYGFNAAGSTDIASAMGVILVAIIGVMVLLFHRFAGRHAL